jgi:hypothetical protein
MYKCQLCLQEIKKENHNDFGTNADGSPQPAYCNVCYNGGNFTEDFVKMSQEEFESVIYGCIFVLAGKSGDAAQEELDVRNHVLAKESPYWRARAAGLIQQKGSERPAAGPVWAFCVKEHQIREMNDVEETTTMPNKGVTRPMLKGHCIACGTDMFLILDAKK